MTLQLTTLREALRDCLAWCERFRMAPPPNHEAYLSADPWPYDGSRYFFQTHPDSIAAVIRSLELAAPALRFLPDSARENYGPAYHVEPWPDAAPETVAAFDRFVQARRQLLAGRATSTVLSDEEVEQELARPRTLLLTDWQATVWDGASAFVSAGFVDLHDVPGWDTWLALIELPDLASADGPTGLCLVSSVPIWASELVEKAISFNPVACISWGTLSATGIHPKGWGLSWDGNQA